MDNITHTLVGAALGQAGLKRRTALALTTLVIGANLPDIDAITYFTGGAIGFRRGWTHGILAIVVLPFLLTAGILAFDRWLRRRRRRALRSDRPAADSRQVLLLAFLAVLTHPFLDWLNTYGLRWLMPFRDVWYHGDAWFIMDPWVWLVLGLGVAASAYLGRRGGYHGVIGRIPASAATRAADTPARIALALVAIYALAMLALSAGGRSTAARALAADSGPATSIMVSPTFGNPLVWDVVARQGDAYRFGTLDVLPWGVRLQATPLPSGLGDPAARAAAAAPQARDFLNWARFPVFQVRRGATSAVVRIADVRYGRQGWAATTVVLPPQ